MNENAITIIKQKINQLKNETHISLLRIIK